MPIRGRRRTVILGAAGVLLFALARARGRVRTVAVAGDSMLPALRPGDWLVVRTGGVRAPGDLVVARHPRRPAVLIVKRATRRSGGGWWLESDNQRARGRRDSWDFGAVPDELVVGRVVARYWPPSRAGWGRVVVAKARVPGGTRAGEGGTRAGEKTAEMVLRIRSG